jgi:hypothetical protein
MDVYGHVWPDANELIRATVGKEIADRRADYSCGPKTVIGLSDHTS